MSASSRRFELPPSFRDVTAEHIGEVIGIIGPGAGGGATRRG